MSTHLFSLFLTKPGLHWQPITHFIVQIGDAGFSQVSTHADPQELNSSFGPHSWLTSDPWGYALLYATATTSKRRTATRVMAIIVVETTLRFEELRWTYVASVTIELFLLSLALLYNPTHDFHTPLPLFAYRASKIFVVTDSRYSPDSSFNYFVISRLAIARGNLFADYRCRYLVYRWNIRVANNERGDANLTVTLLRLIAESVRLESV